MTPLILASLLSVCQPTIIDIHHPTMAKPSLLAILQPEWENGGPLLGYYQMVGTKRCLYAHRYTAKDKKGKWRMAVHLIEVRVRDGETFNMSVLPSEVRPDVLERIP